MVRDAARTWANEELKPIVRDMDDECKTRPEVIQSLFEHGFMGMVRRCRNVVQLHCLIYRENVIRSHDLYSIPAHRKYQRSMVVQE